MQKMNLLQGKENPALDFETIKRAALEERVSSEKYKVEIFEYLSGKRDISILEPYFDDLQQSFIYTWDQEEQRLQKSKLITDCISGNEQFRRRYIAFKAVQHPRIIGIMISAANYNNFAETFENVINMLLAEKVPTLYRIQCYEEINNLYYFRKIEDKFKKILLNSMLKNRNAFDNEYKQYCKLSEDLFMTKVYLEYLEISDSEKNKDEIISMCTNSDKWLRELAVNVVLKHKEYDNEIAELLKSKKMSIRETAVDIFSVWGANNYKDVLSEAAKTEKSAKLANKIQNILDTAITIPENYNQESSLSLLIEKINRGEVGESPLYLSPNKIACFNNKKLLWLYETPNSIVHFSNGTKTNDKYMQAILLCYANMSDFTVSEDANLLVKELNQDEFEKFVLEILSKWISDGANIKKKWVLYFSAIYGGKLIVDIFVRYIKEWSENSRGTLAAEAINALILNGSSKALISIDRIAHKSRHKQMKNAAVQALDNAAEKLRITGEELGDRIIPNFCFDKNRERIFDYGKRKFKVYLTYSLDLEVYENNKKLKTLPTPTEKDDEKLSKQSHTDFKQLKKQLKEVLSTQKLRLEKALIADRRWSNKA